MHKHIPQSEFEKLAVQVRSGENPDSPTIIYRFIHCGHQDALCLPADERKPIYEAIFRILLDTISDPLVPQHWRYTCLDNIHYPLNNLHQLAKTCCERRYAQKLHHEVAITSRYFLSYSHQ